MDNQNEHVSCCFSCAEKSQDANIQVPPLVQNAFPGLVLKDLRYAQTQPFISTIYYPPSNTLSAPIIRQKWQDPVITLQKKLQQRQSTSRAKPTQDDLDDFENLYIWYHEDIHLHILNRTPAKDLVRLLLAFAYDSLLSLAEAKTSSEIKSAWNRFQEAERQIDKIHNNIAFSEELFATTIALNVIREKDLVPGGLFEGFQKPFKKLEERVLQHEERNFPENKATGFPGFTATYNRIQPFLQFSLPIVHSAYLQATYVQAIEFSRLWTSQYSMRFYALDTNERLEYLLNIMENTSNMEEFVKLLKPSLQKITEVWKQLIALMDLNTVGARDECRYKTMPQAFWLLFYGQYQDNLNFNSDEEYSHYIGQILSEYINTGISTTRTMLIYRAAYRDKSYICVNPVYNREEWSEKIMNAHCLLLVFEAIRQQIEARKGIICPFNSDRLSNLGSKRCRCSKEQHDGLLRLSHLAVDSFFGDGKWSLLPCRR